MDLNSVQEIMIMIYGQIPVIVLSSTLVPGGMVTAMIQILMVYILILQLIIIKELFGGIGKVHTLVSSSQR